MSEAQLETLLRSPYVWDSKTYIDFWLACRNDCKSYYYPSNTNGIDSIDSLAGSVVWTTEPNLDTNPHVLREWKNMIPSNLYNSLRYNDSANRYDNYGTTSLSQLLRLIRNNYEHGNEQLYIPRKVNRGLKWYVQINDNGQQEWIFCNNKFAKFWTRYFPMLTPFLWQEFHRRFSTHWGKTRTTFYSKRVLINPDITLDQTQFANELWSAVSNQLDNGGLYKRYRLTSDHKEWKLEFRKLNDELITRILNLPNKVAFEVSENNLIYRAFNNLDLQIENLSWTCNSINDKLCTILIVNSYEDADPLITMFASRNFSSYTVIIFEKQNENANWDVLSDRYRAIAQHLADAAGFVQHQEYPVSFSDLSEVTRDAILSGDNFKIKVGTSTFFFGNIFPNGPPESELIGVALNNFLRTQIIEVHPNPELSQEHIRNISEMPGEIANSTSKCNVIYGRPFVGKTAAVNYHSIHMPNVLVTNCQWDNRHDFLTIDGLINSFVRDNPLHSCIIKGLLENNTHEVDIIVDCNFRETLLLNQNTDILNELQQFCTDIASHSSISVRIFVVLRPHWASKIEEMNKIKYKMTEEVAIRVIQNDNLYSDFTQKDFYNDDFDNKVINLVKNNFELSPIYWNIILEHINNDPVLLDGSPHVTTIAKLIVDSYFRKTGVTDFEDLIFLKLYANKALQEYKDSGLKMSDPMKNHFTNFQEDLRHFTPKYNSAPINSLDDHGLLEVADGSVLKFYDSKMKLYFFVLGLLTVETTSDENYLARREILGYMKNNLKDEFIEMYEQLGSIHKDVFKKINKAK